MKKFGKRRRRKLPKTRSKVLFGQYNNKADGPSISKHPDIHPLHHKPDGVAPLLADPPPLKLHQKAKSATLVKWP